MADPVRSCEFVVATPANSVGAIACLQVRAPDAPAMDGFLRRASIRVPFGRPVLRDLMGIDEGLVIRWDDRTLDLFPHGGVLIVGRLAEALEALGVGQTGAYVYPEAEDAVEQRMLETLARAQSPLAFDRLLGEPGRWRSHEAGASLADAEVLGRLVDPPLVAAVGAPNIGKSTLLNALAGRSVAIVADEPGTTRDHVGALLDLGGLVVRYLDTPGRLARATGIDAAAAAIADSAVTSADLLLLCGDPETPPIAIEGLPGAGSDTKAVLRVCLRSDLRGDRGGARWEADVRISVSDGTGMADVVHAIRERLVPAEALADPRPWRFWDAGEATAPASESAGR